MEVKQGERGYFSPINYHHSNNETFALGSSTTVYGVILKRGWYVIWLLFKIGLCSAISFKRSWRELYIDVTEHRSMLKNYLKYELTPFKSHTQKKG